MADAYKAWLQERIDWYQAECLKSADERGYPGKLRFAEQVLRETLETYQECLERYEALAPCPTPPAADRP